MISSCLCAASPSLLWAPAGSYIMVWALRVSYLCVCFQPCSSVAPGPSTLLAGSGPSFQPDATRGLALSPTLIYFLDSWNNAQPDVWCTSDYRRREAGMEILYRSDALLQSQGDVHRFSAGTLQIHWYTLKQESWEDEGKLLPFSSFLYFPSAVHKTGQQSFGWLVWRFGMKPLFL